MLADVFTDGRVSNGRPAGVQRHLQQGLALGLTPHGPKARRGFGFL